MRRTLLLVLSVLVVLALPGVAAAAEEDLYVFEGGGWGHGVGMPQYGARGQAIEKKTAEQILTYYYSDTKVEPLGESITLWIGLLQNATKVEFQAEVDPVDACAIDLDGNLFCRLAKKGESWEFRVVSGGCRYFRDGSAVGGVMRCQGSLGSLSAPDIRVKLPGTGHTYARGMIRLRPGDQSGRIHASVQIGLEDYLYGLGEMPSSWEVEALQAQAIAGRTYAVYKYRGLDGELQSKCSCHLYATVRDQNYVGWDKESEGTDAKWGKRWKAAVDDTKGRIVTHGGNEIGAFYSSSTGGVTETNATGFGGSLLPYLKSKNDPWSVKKEVNNKFATWTIVVEESKVAAALGWDEVTSAKLVSGPPGAQVTFKGVRGGKNVEQTLYGRQLRSPLGLLSPQITGVAVERFLPFLDIENSGHTANIVTLFELGITKGCTTDLYCPDDPVTRAQMASFLVRGLADELQPATRDHFTDDSNSGHEGNINVLAENDITKGCAPGRYCPDDSVTRAQMASFLVRAFHIPATGETHFTDATNTGHDANINALAEAGITKGCTTNRYCPNEPVTRAQMASFIVRALAWQAGQ